jgi:uncharacterized membrane protein
MKKYLSAGFIILLPIALTVWIISYLINLFTAPLFDIVESCILWYEKSQGLSLSHHETWVVFVSRTIAFVAMFLLILILGYLGRKFFFKAFMNLANQVVVKIPVVGTIYRLTKDITKAMFSSDGKTFKETVLVPFPTPGTHAIAFITSDDVPETLKNAAKDLEVTVFVPTAPHPMSGYVLFCPRSATHNVNISSEETFKFLLSCGVIEPKQKSGNEPQ